MLTPWATHLDVQDALEVCGGARGQEREEVVDQVLGAAAHHLEQGLHAPHLPAHVPRQGRRGALRALACTRSSAVDPQALNASGFGLHARAR